MSAYSVVVLLPGGEFRHQVVWAGAPEDVGDAIRVPPGSRVIMTEMANALIWDSGPAEAEEAAPEAAPVHPRGQAMVIVIVQIPIAPRAQCPPVSIL